MFPSEGTSGASKSKGQNVAFTPKLQHSIRKYNDSSLEADETESELVAIPESDLSDSTLHGSSAPGSFDDTIHFEEMSVPKVENFRMRTEEVILICRYFKIIEKKSISSFIETIKNNAQVHDNYKNW